MRMTKKEICYIDANILIDYFDIKIDVDRKDAINKFFTRSNIGNREIKIFSIALGEVFKIIIEKQLCKENFDKKIENIRKEIKFVRIDDLDVKEFLKHYKEIDKLDNRVDQADKFNLSAFCSDEKARIFYTNDSKIIESNLIEYLRNIRKTIKEIK